MKRKMDDDRVMIELHNESDTFIAMNTALRVATEMGFDKLDRNLVATAVSEIAVNAIRYGSNGKVTIKPTTNKRGLTITVEDKGPGIPDVEKALRDGFTTQKTSLGVGLGAAKRAMDEFTIRSRPGKGTKVVMKKFLSMTGDKVSYGVVSLPDVNYTFNGDIYVIKEYDGDKLLLAVVDGLGQGEKAFRSATLVKDILEAYYTMALDELLLECDSTLREQKDTAGAAISLLRIKNKELQYAGVGDTFVQVLSNSKIFFASQPGIVGMFRMPKIRVVSKRYSSKEMLVVMCTDGIHNHFSKYDLPYTESPQTIADHIMQHHRRQFGDATVLVAKFSSHET